jgi:hypothetical protein
MPPTTQQKLTPDQFAEKIKAQYPAYANIDNSTLTQKMLAKYPQYADKVDMGGTAGAPTQGAITGPEGGGFFSSIGKGITDFGVGVGTSIGKGLFGIAETAAKGVGLVAGLTGGEAGKKQWADIAGGIKGASQALYDQPQFQKANASLPGMAGNVVGTVAQFAAPGGAITKAQGVVGALTEASPWIVRKLSQAGVESIGSGATQLGVSGGDTKSAQDVALGAGLLSFASHAASDIYRKVIPQTVKDNVAGMFGYTGKQLGSELASGKKVKDGVMTLTNIVDMNAKKPFEVVDEFGAKKPYNPVGASASETLQAYYQMMQRAYTNYTEIATKAGDAGATLGQKDFTSILAKLKEYADPKRGPEFNNKANALIRQIEAFGKRNPVDGKVYFKNISPAAIQQLVQDANKAVAPGSDAATAEVAQTTSKALREIMDSKIESATGAQYQEARNVYSQGKAIENEMVAMVKKSLKQEGLPGSFIDGLATIDMVQGLLTGNPALAVRGFAIGGVKATFKALRDPLIKMNRALQYLAEGDKAQTPTAERLLGKTPTRAGAPVAASAPQVKAPPLSQGKIGAGTAAIIGGATAIGAGIIAGGNALSRSDVQGKADPQKAYDQMHTQSQTFAKGIAHAETSTVTGDAYKYVHPNSGGSKDYGKYGINDGFFKSPGLMNRYAGGKVTIEQVLNSPALQDSIVQNFYAYWKSKGETDNEIARKWTAGESSDAKKSPRPQYIRNFRIGTTTP